MAASLVIEYESGTISGTAHRHDGYCSGFFGGHPVGDDQIPVRIGGDTTRGER
ncbi:MAG TPA: hypothetical protein VFK52_02425 [Nocardioidaceae bacterium]|nr:hypothetical protein [Nocardioidaceae bacterium]